MGGLPKLFNKKARTFAPPDKDEKRLKLQGIKIPEDFDSDKYFKGEENKYLDINLSDVDNLVGKIKQDFKKIDNIIDIGNNESINFNDILNFSKDIMNDKINNSNKEKKYNEKFKNIEENLENKTKDNNTIKLDIIYLNLLKKILFTLKKSSGKSLTNNDLPILLSKIYANNNSKEIINEITQLTKKLCYNKQ